MNGNEWRGGLAVLGHDREPGDRQSRQPYLLAYCAVSGVVGTAAATVTSLAATGVTRIAIWVAVIGSTSLLAGLGYDSRPVRFLWSACRASRRRRVDP
jgi:hypothetical protein